MPDNAQKPAAKAHSLQLSSLQLSEHRLLTVTGVKAVPTFTDKLITVELEGETLSVTGHDLIVKGLDLETGRFSAAGWVTSMRYSTAPDPSSFLKRIFK